MAHFRYVHGYDSVSRIEPVSVDGHCLESRFDFSTTRGIAGIATLTFDFSVSTHVVGLGYSFVEFRELSIGMDMRIWILATPVDGTLIDLSVVSQVGEIRNPSRRIAGLGFLPLRMRAPVMNKFMASLQKRDVLQDVAIWSRKQYRSRPRLCRSDGEIMLYRTYCTQFYPEPLDSNDGESRSSSESQRKSRSRQPVKPPEAASDRSQRCAP